MAIWSSTCVSQWPALELGHDKTYDAFGLLAATKYGGDFEAAARDLRVNEADLAGKLPRSERAPAGVVDLRTEPSRAAPKSRFEVTPLEELWALPDQIDWLVEGLWVRGSYGQLAGQMKTLKYQGVVRCPAISMRKADPLFGPMPSLAIKPCMRAATGCSSG